MNTFVKASLYFASLFGVARPAISCRSLYDNRHTPFDLAHSFSALEYAVISLFFRA